jgi:regulator of cell morphogenesis and NO signaling
MTDLARRALGDLVVEHPGAASVLESAGLDYCCGGTRSLADACAETGLDVGALAAEIEAADAGDEIDWASLPVPALADHIVATHHAYLRAELPLLVALAAKVEAAHEVRHRELANVRALVDELRAEIEPHLDKEERVLFPAFHQLVEEGRTTFPFGTVANPIRVMLAEHDRAGELLAELRETTRAFDVPGDGCASYRSLYERLEALEHDTHRHVHKENHALFPAAIAALEALTGPGGRDEAGER